MSASASIRLLAPCFRIANGKGETHVKTTPASDNFRAYKLDSSRRDFLKLATVVGSLPLLPSAALASIFSDERTAWYRNAKFGMFIHWGPYSLASIEASWPIMTPKPGGITEAEYVELPKRFNPVKFDPRALLASFAAAASCQTLSFAYGLLVIFMFDYAFTNSQKPS